MRALISKCVPLLVIFSAAACTEPFAPPTAVTGAPAGGVASSVALTAPASMLTVGQSLQLSAVVLDAAGNSLSNQPVTWSTSNSGIATVSATGLVLAVGLGSVQVMAGSGSAEARASLSVASSVPVPTVPAPSSGAAALPNQFLATDMPASPAAGAKLIAVAATGDLQQALDAAQPGDVIELAAGATYVGNFVLPNKSTGSTSWIVIRPAIAAASLPPEGTRMTPQLAAVLRLPKVLSPNSQPAFRTAATAHHYRIVALEISVMNGQTTSYGTLMLGASGDEGQTSLAAVPHDLVLDRLYVHGFPSLNLRRCVTLNSAASAVIDSYLSECHEAGADAQAIGGWNGPGPFKIVNNYLEGSGENILFGGGDPAIADLVPSDIEIRRNHVIKPTSWRGGPWVIKNLLELKNAERVLIEANVFENNWEHAQDGSAMQLQSNNQDGNAPWSRTWDVTVRNNIIRNTGGGIVIAAAPQVHPTVHARRFTLENNLIQNINLPGFGGTGRGLSLFGDLADVLIAHNTIPSTTNSAITFDGKLSTPTTRLVVRDNILSGGLYGIIGSNTGSGLPSWQAWAPDGQFTNNAVIIDTQGTPYPAGNFFPKAASFVGFENYAGGDFRLSLVSPFKGKGTDGKDIGADVSVIEAAVRGVVIP